MVHLAFLSEHEKALRLVKGPNTSGARAGGVEDDELADFRKLVKAYAGLTTDQVNQLIRENDWMEICNGDQT